MKKWWLMMLVCWMSTSQGFAQSHEVQQLLLNVAKLEQFKQILSDMKKGYDILVRGYGIIRDISQGNFSLHKTFLDALFEVSPTVRRYKKIADIVDMQLRLARQYRTAYDRFRHSGQFTEKEIDYLARVYGRLINQSLAQLDDLAMVITAGRLRMSDEERLAAVDRIHADMADKLQFLQVFNGQTSVLLVQRAKENSDVKALEGMIK